MQPHKFIRQIRHDSIFYVLILNTKSISRHYGLCEPWNIFKALTFSHGPDVLQGEEDEFFYHLENEERNWQRAV